MPILPAASTSAPRPFLRQPGRPAGRAGSPRRADAAGALAGGGERYVAAPPRPRQADSPASGSSCCVDPDSPFLELSPLAAWGTEFTVGASVVTGIGVVSGVECVIIGHDPTVRGGAMNPYSLRKTLRALEIARINRLPVVNLVESGGADLPTPGRPVRAGRADLPRPDRAVRAGHPDDRAGLRQLDGRRRLRARHVRLRRAGRPSSAKVFLGGPPLVKMATGEEADDEALGGADDALAGLRPVDYFAVDEHDAIRLGRAIIARLNWRKLGPAAAGTPADPKYDPDELLGIRPAGPQGARSTRARCSPASSTARSSTSTSRATARRWSPAGRGSTAIPVGVLANHRGVLFSEEAKKASEFILLANQTDTPLVFLQNTTGYMVGTRVRAGRHHQGRRQDDQRRDEQRGAAPHDQHGALVRRRELRHVAGAPTTRGSCSPGRTRSSR